MQNTQQATISPFLPFVRNAKLSLHAKADLCRLLTPQSQFRSRDMETLPSQEPADHLIFPATLASSLRRIPPPRPFQVRNHRMPSPSPNQFIVRPLEQVLAHRSHSAVPPALLNELPVTNTTSCSCRPCTTFGDNIPPQQIAVLSRMMKAEKRVNKERLRERPPSYYKVSLEWAARKGVDASQLNSPPNFRPKRNKERSLGPEAAAVNTCVPVPCLSKHHHLHVHHHQL